MRRLAETPAREKSFSLYEAVHQLEVKLIRRALDDPGGSVTKAARLSGVTRQTLNAMLDGAQAPPRQEDAPEEKAEKYRQTAGRPITPFLPEVMARPGPTKEERAAPWLPLTC